MNSSEPGANEKRRVRTYPFLVARLSPWQLLEERVRTLSHSDETRGKGGGCGGYVIDAVRRRNGRNFAAIFGVFRSIYMFACLTKFRPN